MTRGSYRRGDPGDTQWVRDEVLAAPVLAYEEYFQSPTLVRDAAPLGPEKPARRSANIFVCVFEGLVKERVGERQRA